MHIRLTKCRFVGRSRQAC